MHRVTAGTIGVLCQLEAEAPWRAELEKWLPGFKKPARESASSYQNSGSSLPSIARTFSRLHRSQ